MSPFGDRTSDVLSIAMIGGSARQRVLSSNLANADTPGYRRMDVSFEGALADAVREDRSMTGSADGGSSGIDASMRGGSPLDEPLTSLQGSPGVVLRVDGANVDPDQEMAELAANQLAYDTVTGLLRKRLATMRSAMSST